MSAIAGFGNSPRSFALRITTVGHASARWRGAKSDQDADRKNYDLSSKRADTVHALIEKELKSRLGNDLSIEYAVSSIEPRAASGVSMGAQAEGSLEALRLRKNRQDNSAADRRVEVKIEKITTTYTSGRVSLPPQRISGLTKHWALGVTKLRMTAIGGAIGSVEIRLRNRVTDKSMYATADLYGGGLGGGAAKAGKNIKKQIVNQAKKQLTQALADFLGRGEVYFELSRESGFSDFDGEFIRLGNATAALGIKAVYAYATFPSKTHSPDPLVFQKKISLGLIDLEGWVASGVLELRGTNPGDWWEYDREDTVYDSYDKVWDESLAVSFSTGKWTLLPKEAEKVTQSAASWASRYI